MFGDYADANHVITLMKYVTAMRLVKKLKLSARSYEPDNIKTDKKDKPHR